MSNLANQWSNQNKTADKDNGIEVRTISNQFNELLNSDNAHKSNVINNAFPDSLQTNFNEALINTIEDLAGVAEAHKHGAFESEQEVHDQVKLFLEDYTVKLLELLNKSK